MKFNFEVSMGWLNMSFSLTGNPVTYTNWISGRKDNYYSHNVEDCSVFVPYINRGQWDDIPCGSSSSLLEPLYETHYFICQFGKIWFTSWAGKTLINATEYSRVFFSFWLIFWNDDERVCVQVSICICFYLLYALPLQWASNTAVNF